MQKSSIISLCRDTQDSTSLYAVIQIAGKDAFSMQVILVRRPSFRTCLLLFVSRRMSIFHDNMTVCAGIFIAFRQPQRLSSFVNLFAWQLLAKHGEGKKFGKQHCSHKRKNIYALLTKGEWKWNILKRELWGQIFSLACLSLSAFGQKSLLRRRPLIKNHP